MVFGENIHRLIPVAMAPKSLEYASKSINSRFIADTRW